MKQRRRRRLLAQPFPDAWLVALRSNVRHYDFLPPGQQEMLRRKTAIFIAEKTWVPCGQAIDDQLRVTVAGQACVLLLGIDEDYCFDGIRSVFVSPGGPDHPLYVERWNLQPGARFSGEAWARGPLLLAWTHALAGARGSPDGRNLILHELAHHLDDLDGQLDGIPAFELPEDRSRWEEEYVRLARSSEPQEIRLLAEYLVPDAVDFFAVATECFFQRPAALRRQHGGIYDLLARFYRQNPAGAWPEAVADTPEAARDRLAEQEIVYEASVRECVRQMRLPPAGGDASFAEGVIHMQHGRQEKAVACYDRAIELAPDDAEAYYQRGLSQAEAGRHDEAIADYSSAICCRPTRVEYYVARCKAYHALGTWDRAEADRQEAIRLDPRLGGDSPSG